MEVTSYKKLERDKIKKYNLDKVIFRLRKDGMVVRQIKDEILRETGVDISEKSIYDFLKKDENVKKELLQKDTELQKTARELAVDYRKEINDILSEVKSIKKDALAEKDYQIVDKMIGRLFQGLELINKIVDGNSIKNQKVDIKVLYQNIFDETHEKYKTLKQGVFSEDINVDDYIKENDKIEEEKLKKEINDSDNIIDADYKDVRELVGENDE